MDFTGRFPPAPACFSCVARQPQVPISFPTVCCLAEGFVLSLVQGLLVEFRFFSVG